MYVAVKGGERAILGSYALLGEQRRGDPGVPELSAHFDDAIRDEDTFGVTLRAV